MRAYALFLVLVACGGNVGQSSSDSGPIVTHDAGGTSDADFGPATEAGPDADALMAIPPGSILALARGPNQNDYLTVVRITLPSGAVTPLWTFTPQAGYHPHAIAKRPDGDIDRLDVEGPLSTGRTHILPVSKSTGAPVGPERVIDGVVSGADYGPDGKLWSAWWMQTTGERIVTIDAMGNLTPVAPKVPLGINDVGVMGKVIAALECVCSEDLLSSDIRVFSPTGTDLGAITPWMKLWNAMTPMGSFIVVLDDYGYIQVFDPVTQLWSAEIKTPWHYRDATEDQ